MLIALIASAYAAPPPEGDNALFWAVHRANVALVEETEGYRAQTVPLMFANGDSVEAIRDEIVARRAALDGLAADRAKLAADTEAAGFDPTEQLALHDAAVARIEALMPENLATVLSFQLKMNESYADLDDWRRLGDVVVATADALPPDSLGLLLIAVASNIGKAGDRDGTIRYATACTDLCSEATSKAGAWYLLMNEYARRSDGDACRAAAEQLLALPEVEARWTADARMVLGQTTENPENPGEPTEPVVTPEEPPDHVRRPLFHHEYDEPGFILFRGGGTYDLGERSLDGEAVHRFSGYNLGYGYAERYLGFDFAFRHDGWRVGEGPLEMRTNRLEFGLIVDLLGFSSERRLRPTLGPYGALGLGWGKHTEADTDHQMLALGVVYGGKAGLGVRIGKDFLMEAQARLARSPYAWGYDGTPLGYAFTRGWEFQGAVSIGTQAD